MKATKMVPMWLERGDPPIQFKYRIASEQCMVAKIHNHLVYQIIKKRLIETNKSHNSRKKIVYDVLMF